MIPVHGLTGDNVAEPADVHEGLAGRHVPGLSDEVGDRVVILDDRQSPSLELLRFRQTLTAMPGFEVALRRRVERLRQFRHRSFEMPPAVEYLSGDRGLVLLSNYTPGVRLSQVLPLARDPTFASTLLQQLTPALAALHHYGDGIGHGALVASRIVIAPGGHLVIVEYVLGTALDRLQLPATRLYFDLGVPSPPSGISSRPRFDARTDLFQLGLIALSLLLGRRLSLEEYPENIASALDQVAEVADSQSAEKFSLLEWLERALQVNGHAFPSSIDALDALRNFPETTVEQSGRRWRELLGIHAQADERPALPVPDYELVASLVGGSVAVGTGHAEPAVVTEVVVPTPIQDVSKLPVDTLSVSDESLPDFSDLPVMDQPEIGPSSTRRGGDIPSWWSVAAAESVKGDAPPLGPRPAPQPAASSAPKRPWIPVGWMRRKPSGASRWLVAALAVLAIGEALVIAGLLQRQWATPLPVPFPEIHLETQEPGASVVVDGQSAGVTPLQLKISPETRSISVVDNRPAQKPELIVGSTGQENPAAAPPVAVAPKPAARTAAAPVTAPPQRSGGMRFVSPIELDVFEGDTRLGSSTTGIVSAPAGRHELELVNSVLGYRGRQVVDITPGQVVSVTVSPPNGRVNINASPWAEVWINGKSVGETPIGNLSLPLGQHEIIFRHPQFGEHRQTVTVRLDAVARVSANMQR
jgi:hypothetical protein